MNFEKRSLLWILLKGNKRTYDVLTSQRVYQKLLAASLSEILENAPKDKAKTHLQQSLRRKEIGSLKAKRVLVRKIINEYFEKIPLNPFH